MVTSLICGQKQHPQRFLCQFRGTCPRCGSYVYSSVLKFGEDRGYFAIERKVLSTPTFSE